MVIALVQTKSRMGNVALLLAIVVVGMPFLYRAGRLSRRGLWVLFSVVLIDVAVIGQWVGIDRVADRLNETALVRLDRGALRTSRPLEYQVRRKSGVPTGNDYCPGCLTTVPLCMHSGAKRLPHLIRVLTYLQPDFRANLALRPYCTMRATRQFPTGLEEANMVGAATARLSFTLAEAAESTGYSIDVIRRAIRAGDILTVAPLVNGRTISRRMITYSELARWVESGEPRCPVTPSSPPP